MSATIRPLTSSRGQRLSERGCSRGRPPSARPTDCQAQPEGPLRQQRPCRRQWQRCRCGAEFLAGSWISGRHVWAAIRGESCLCQSVLGEFASAVGGAYDRGSALLLCTPPMAMMPTELTPPMATTPTAFTPPTATNPTALTGLMTTKAYSI